MTRVLITGASGYVARRLLENWPKDLGFPETTDLDGSVDYLGSLTDSKFVQKLPDFDVVVHLASQQYFSRNLPLFRRGAYIRRSNLEMAENLVGRFSSRVRLIAIGSSMQYGPGQVSEARRGHFDGKGPYSESKTASFEIYNEHFESVAWLVPPVIIDEERGGIVKTIGSVSTKTGLFPIAANGSDSISVIARNDFVSYIITVIESDIEGVIHCSSESNLSFASIERKIQDLLPRGQLKRVSIPKFALRAVSKLSGGVILAPEQVALLMATQELVPDRGESFNFPLSNPDLMLEGLAKSWSDKGISNDIP